MLTKEQAYDIASQYGSLIRAGDPGACFYRFRFNDGRPATEAHREECLAYAESLEKDFAGRHWTAQDDETDEEAAEIAQDVDNLRALLEFFRASDLRS